MTNPIEEMNQHLTDTYDPSLFLGRLAWYSISEECSVQHTALCAAMIEAFAPTGIIPDLPPGLRVVDIFKRACKAAERKNVMAIGHKADEQIRSNYIVRPTGGDPDTVWRNIVRENVDGEGHHLDYKDQVQIKFNRKAETIDFNMFPSYYTSPGVEDLNTKTMLEEIVQYYNEKSQVLVAYSIRVLIQRVLQNQLLGIKVRPSGGIYFIGEQFAPGLAAMESVVNGLEGGTMHSLPLMDDKKQREMLRLAFEEESISEIDTMIGEIGEILGSDQKISIEKYGKLRDQYDMCKQKCLDFSDLLNDALESTAIRLELCNTQLYDLIGSVKS